MQDCPFCGEKTISNFSKFMLGPARSIICSNCKSKISISWWSMVLVLMYIVLMRTIMSLNDSGLSLFLLILSLIPYGIAHFHLVPLVVRESREIRK